MDVDDTKTNNAILFFSSYFYLSIFITHILVGKSGFETYILEIKIFFFKISFQCLNF